MSTIVVNPGDVIVVNDSIAVKMSKVTEILQPVVKRAETNWQDVIIPVAITFAVCATIIIVEWIAKSAILSWKEKVINAQKQERDDKNQNEEDEYKRKQDADRENRTNMLKDEERKRKTVLIDKKLQILYEICYDLNKEEPQKVVKKYDDEAVKNYIAALNDALGTKSTSKTESNE
jgi:hypothetical protein